MVHDQNARTQAVLIPETANLDLADSGLVYLQSLPDAFLFDSLLCGFVGCPGWPAALGAEPEWFGWQVGQLQDWWDRERALDEGEGWDYLDMRAERREVI
jgi:hypothetical protein